MQSPQRVVEILLDDKISLTEKAETLEDLLLWHKVLAKRMGTGSAFGQELAFATLFKALPPGVLDIESKLKDVIAEISNYNTKENVRNLRQKSNVAKELKSLSQGTPIVIRNRNREDTVTFLELKRTRMVCEYPDGRLYSVPVTAFVRVHNGPDTGRLDTDEARRRELIRHLSGRGKSAARKEILGRGRDMIKSLLDELGAAMERIENAPEGFSSGLMSSALGIVKLISPRDRALVKTIPGVLVEIGESIGRSRLKKMIAEHADDAVKERLKHFLS